MAEGESEKAHDQAYEEEVSAILLMLMSTTSIRTKRGSFLVQKSNLQGHAMEHYACW